MNKKTIKSIVKSMPRMDYFDNLQYLKHYSNKFQLKVDVNFLHFSETDVYCAFPVSIAAISSTLFKNNCLYILTKKNILHYINNATKEHDIIDVNDSIWTKIKLIIQLLIIKI